MSGLYEWTPEEQIKVAALNEAADNLRYLFIEKREENEMHYPKMSLLNIEPKDEFERGIMAAIGMLRHHVHCMNPG